MNKFVLLYTAALLQLILFTTVSNAQVNQPASINLAGKWGFRIDSLDRGEQEQWFKQQFKETISLPGSMTANGKGNEITVKTKWTGSIWDSSWFNKDKYLKYRQPGNIKVPFWLQPVKYYQGAAWYQTKVMIPPSWAKNKIIKLFLERTHWETTVWIDDKKIGTQNSLGTPHVFDFSKLSSGLHTFTVRIDNRIKDINVGVNSHSVSDHTQTNWNGMIGDIFLIAKPLVHITDVQLFPDIQNKQVKARISVENASGKKMAGTLRIHAVSDNREDVKLSPLTKKLELNIGDSSFEIVYPMGERPLLWDEFTPNLYTFKASLLNADPTEKEVIFGMREFATRNKQFTINGRLTFLRGTLECAIFPKTGYPPTNMEEWMRIFSVCKSYGLNHVRFHSWCPPEAAFIAADKSGIYLQVEVSSWANQGASIGDGLPLDRYIYDESKRMVAAYGNHPSFCMMTYGNEPGGKKKEQYLAGFVKYWKDADSRRLYTTGAGWPVMPVSDYNSTPDPRIQGWGQGLKSIINSEPPRNDYDWSSVVKKWSQPTVSHEIGQWCVYPDFKEIKKYTGILKAKNFEIFEESLKANGLHSLADSFLLASGKLQALCYKADIEAALRTPDFGGFQLLDLHDFPGQGTALVGVLNAFWEDKGYISGKEYSQFCNSTVPLVRLPKMIYLNTETLSAPVEIAHFGTSKLTKTETHWSVKDTSGKIIFKGQFSAADIPLGNAIKLGTINQSLAEIKKPSQLKLTVRVGRYENAWDIYVYPTLLPKEDHEILVTQRLDDNALEVLNKGGKVLLTTRKGSLKTEYGGDIKTGFSSIFWNTAWTNAQPPHTLGILCNPHHPAFDYFPTEYHSNWQWWDAMTNSNAIILSAFPSGLKPIVRVIDDWFSARPLGLIFECKVGKGSLLISSIDLLSNADSRPEATQLLFSLKRYMSSANFKPSVQINFDSLKNIFI